MPTIPRLAYQNRLPNRCMPSEERLARREHLHAGGAFRPFLRAGRPARTSPRALAASSAISAGESLFDDGRPFLGRRRARPRNRGGRRREFAGEVE